MDNDQKPISPSLSQTPQVFSSGVQTTPVTGGVETGQIQPNPSTPSSKKSLIIGVIVLLLLAGGVAAYIIFGKNRTISPSVTSNSSANAQTKVKDSEFCWLDTSGNTPLIECVNYGETQIRTIGIPTSLRNQKVVGIYPSPNGQKVAVQINTSGINGSGTYVNSTDVWIMDSSFHKLRNLNLNGLSTSNLYLAWNPDSKRILVEVGNSKGTQALTEFDADTGQAGKTITASYANTVLEQVDSRIQGPIYTPDANAIIFEGDYYNTSSNATDSQLYRINSDGSNLRALGINADVFTYVGSKLLVDISSSSGMEGNSSSKNKLVYIDPNAVNLLGSEEKLPNINPDDGGTPSDIVEGGLLASNDGKSLLFIGTLGGLLVNKAHLHFYDLTTDKDSVVSVNGQPIAPFNANGL